ncbi:hypothetical protein BaRGS_00033352 [Batillaria attramentaria]|uniref:Uncharacterized protein n=1 Tax=Batillaria attramentaria TaxID=370345 RepID=A0ABD0JK58_9CAEN
MDITSTKTHFADERMGAAVALVGEYILRNSMSRTSETRLYTGIQADNYNAAASKIMATGEERLLEVSLVPRQRHGQSEKGHSIMDNADVIKSHLGCRRRAESMSRVTDRGQNRRTQ